MREKIIVLKAQAGDLRTGRYFSKLAALRDLHQLNLEYGGEKKISRDYMIYTFIASEGQSKIELVDDYMNDIAYISLQHIPENIIIFVTKWLKDTIGAYDMTEIKACLNNDFTNKNKFLTHLGLMQDKEEKDIETLEIVKSALKSDDPEVIEKALIVSQLLGWPEFAPQVKNIYESSQDLHIKEFAEKFLTQI
ncbi:hypothetical protein [Deinococcus altitudinis]|uniref:hypothetical protein n=1 Tax=Deinococcus altitudinis TaxID=468914 RepID=UPI0038920829